MSPELFKIAQLELKIQALQNKITGLTIAGNNLQNSLDGLGTMEQEYGHWHRKVEEQLKAWKSVTL